MIDYTRSLVKIQPNFPELFDWVQSITRYGDFDKFVLVDPPEENPVQNVRIQIWTEENAYIIRARLPKDDDNGYLGCVVSNRKPRAGEDWTRGSDLPDGPYNEETWREIVNTILAYELSKLDISNSQSAAIEDVEKQPLLGKEVISSQMEEMTMEINTNVN